MGLWCALSAYALWGVMPLYWKQLGAVSALEIMLQRLWWSFVLLLLYVIVSKRLARILQILKNKRLVMLLFLSSALISSNWFTFIWAVNDGQIIATSLGYFLAPIFNMLCGVILFKDTLSRPQWLAVVLAGIGVGSQLIIAGQLPFVSLFLSLSFVIYGVLRKIAPVGTVDGMFVETMLLAPIGLAWLLWLGFDNALWFGQNAFWLENILLVTTGVITVFPMLLFTYGARHLRLTTLGLVQYLSPTFTLLIGVLVYGEAVSVAYSISFIFIWGGLLIYSLESLRQYRKAQKLMAKKNGA